MIEIPMDSQTVALFLNDSARRKFRPHPTVFQWFKTRQQLIFEHHETESVTKVNIRLPYVHDLSPFSHKGVYEEENWQQRVVAVVMIQMLDNTQILWI